MTAPADRKIQTYICTGCDIGQSIDVEKLSKLPVDEFQHETPKTHKFLCSAEGIDFIKKDIKAGVDCALVAACSPRLLEESFNFPPAIVVRVDLRESVAWISEPKTENTQMMAEDYLRMGIVKAQQVEKPEPYKETLSRELLVVGGGTTGLTAALEAADAGSNVVLVEKSGVLGGFALKLKKRFPLGRDFDELRETGIKEKIEAVNYNDKITIHTSAVIDSISGQPGMFDVTLKNNGVEEKFRVGAIVQATGFKPYDANKLGHLGYGKVKNVVTSVEFEEMAANGKIKRPSDSGEAKSVAFIQCAGSRDEKHLPYCSSVCCMTTLKQASYLREMGGDRKVFVFYKDIRTPGKYEFYYKKVQDDDGVFFTKAEVLSIEDGGDGSVTVTARDTLLGGEEMKVRVDMVVLATGMETAASNGGALNLTYRQGPELPELTNGFPDSHFICFPYETRRTGIYAAGSVRHPMDMEFSEIDARGAVMKAIQCLELSAQGKSVHPRSGDTSYPEIALERCTQCKRCTEECPFGMYDEDEKFNPLPNPLRCRRCGTCMGACPQRIISFKDYNVDIISSQIKAISMPPEEDEKPRVLLLVCENDTQPAFDMAGLSRLKLSPFIRVISLRCTGSMSMVFLNDAFAAGIDGVIVMGCKFGDDYQCHNATGSELANERLGKLEETLGRMMIEPERVQFTPVAISDYTKLPGIIDEFMELIDTMGPNPFKEFADFG